MSKHTSVCGHCGTPFSSGGEDEKFCCKGCEFVHELIHDEGLDRFYDLRQDAQVRPARSLPFEAHDFAWLAAKVETLEADAPPEMVMDAHFSLDGISCVGCVWLVEKLFMRRDGAVEISAHPATAKVHLEWVSGQMDLPAFATELASFGYGLVPLRAGNAKRETGALGAKMGLCGAFALNAMAFTLPRYLGMPGDFAFSHIFDLVTFFSATLSMLVGGSYFIQRAWRATRAGSLHIDLPIALGLVLAFAGSLAGWAFRIEGLLYFDFVSTFVFLMLGGRYLQLSAMDKNRSRLQRHRPVPETLGDLEDGEMVALDRVEAGFRYALKPGQAVPMASVLETEAIDFSLEWISGEADSQTFHAGRTLPAGAIHLGKDPAYLTASETWSESLLSRLVTDERPVTVVPGLERLLRFYLLAVLVIGVAGFLAWYAHGGLAAAVQVMISVFVVSCPCALGVALPLADELAGAIMERAGVFIREPLFWSRLRKVRTIIFDKTGTLTLERPVLRSPSAITSLEDGARLALARLTGGSLHPVSRALIESLGSEGQRLLRTHPAVEVTEVPGTGRHFTDGGAHWSLGRPQEEGAHDSELRKDGEMVARFRFVESLRPDAVAALEDLRKRHRLVILSGDRQEKVDAAAELLGIPECDAHGLLQPEDKETILRSLGHQDTLFIGDGANDSLAFNAAWTTGTPVVDRSLLESKADFYFLGKGLRFLPKLFRLAHLRRSVARTAFGFAVVYNLSAVAVALSGHMNPLLAAILMPLSSAVSLGIVAFGMRDRLLGEVAVDGSGKDDYDADRDGKKKRNEHVERLEKLRTKPV